MHQCCLIFTLHSLNAFKVYHFNVQKRVTKNMKLWQALCNILDITPSSCHLLSGRREVVRCGISIFSTLNSKDSGVISESWCNNHATSSPGFISVTVYQYFLPEAIFRYIPHISQENAKRECF